MIYNSLRGLGMVVYLDVLLIENFIVDFFLLLLSYNIIRYKVKTKRVIISAIIGSLYTLVMIFPKLYVFSYLPIELIVAYLMNIIIAGRRKWILSIKVTVIFLISTVTLSGICFYLSQFQNRYSFKNGFSMNNVSLKCILLGIMIIYIIYNRAISYLKERSIIKNFIFDIKITLNNVDYVIKGFLDTGNELREPITNLPCIIVEENLFRNYKVDENKVYYINYSALGYDGKIRGFRADKVMIKEEGEKFKEVQVIICPCKDLLNKDDDFNALLSRGVI